MQVARCGDGIGGRSLVGWNGVGARGWGGRRWGAGFRGVCVELGDGGGGAGGPGRVWGWNEVEGV